MKKAGFCFSVLPGIALLLGSVMRTPDLPRAESAAREANRKERPDRFLSVSSPRGLIKINFALEGGADSGGIPFYSVEYKGTAVIIPSRLGLVLEGQAPLAAEFEVKGTARKRHRSVYRPPFGERHEAPDRYNELIISLREKHPPVRGLDLVFRAYDEGAAFRYRLPSGPDRESPVISSEETEFRFPGDFLCYAEQGTEGVYNKIPLSQIPSGCELPLTVEASPGLFVCLNEAALNDYSRMQLAPVDTEGRPYLKIQLMSPVQAATPLSTPWRVIMLAETPGRLLEQNYLIDILNPPCRIEDTSWIRPGKAIREVTLTTEGGLACVDFAAAHGLQYVEYDAGWYGLGYREEHNPASDSRVVAPGIDLPRVIAHAREKGIGVLLYVNRAALERQLDEILPLYQTWGVQGLKFGFVDGRTQAGLRFVHEAVRKAAAHGFVVDIHDNYRPTGFHRTFPNLLTQEGVRGNEHMPDARHNVTLPFTRYVAGAADYTVCFYSGGIKTTWAHQLAIPVVFYSPLQFLFWYDRPSHYAGEKEAEFFEQVPTTWDETRVLMAEIGEFVSLARRKEKRWFVGTMTNEQARILDIPLSFLKNSFPYLATVYSDEDVRRVKIERFIVSRDDVLRAWMLPSGGQAVILAPASALDVQTLRRYKHQDD